MVISKNTKWRLLIFFFAICISAVIFFNKKHTSNNQLYLGDYPSNKDFVWSDECQGITHDSSFWYISQYNAIWKIPVSYDLNNDFSEEVKRVGIPQKLRKENYDHFGDIDIYNGYLYLTLTNKEHLFPKIVVFNASDLSFVSEANLGEPLQQGMLSSCAINPQDGLLYTSKFGNTGEGLYVYHQEIVNNQLILKYLKTFPLYKKNGINPIKLHKIQGVKFSKSSDLMYIVSDNRSIFKKGGIYIFDSNTGNMVNRIKVSYKNSHEELQGLTIWDLNNGIAPGMSGQLHLIMIDNIGEGQKDRSSIKHYEMSKEKLLIEKEELN